MYDIDGVSGERASCMEGSDNGQETNKCQEEIDEGWSYEAEAIYYGSDTMMMPLWYY